MLGGVSWNLLLAVVPVALAYTIAWGMGKRGASRRIPLMLNLVLGAAWLAFLPNTCYLLTEWRHLVFDRRWDAQLASGAGYQAEMLSLAKWVAFYLLYSGTGVLLFTLAIRPIARALRSSGRPSLLVALVAPAFFFLVSLGVYMGLIVRLNSWDLITRPASVWTTLQDALTNNRLLGVIAIFALLLWVLYVLVDIWVDAVAARFRKPAPARSR